MRRGRHASLLEEGNRSPKSYMLKALLEITEISSVSNQEKIISRPARVLLLVGMTTNGKFNREIQRRKQKRESW